MIEHEAMRARLPADLLAASRMAASAAGLSLDLWVQRALELALADRRMAAPDAHPTIDELLAVLRRRLGWPVRP